MSETTNPEREAAWVVYRDSHKHQLPKSDLTLLAIQNLAFEAGWMARGEFERDNWRNWQK